MELLLVLMLLLVLDVAALRWGYDSRDDFGPAARPTAAPPHRAGLGADFSDRD